MIKDFNALGISLDMLKQMTIDGSYVGFTLENYDVKFTKLKKGKAIRLVGCESCETWIYNRQLESVSSEA